MDTDLYDNVGARCKYIYVYIACTLHLSLNINNQRLALFRNIVYF